MGDTPASLGMCTIHCPVCCLDDATQHKSGPPLAILNLAGLHWHAVDSPSPACSKDYTLHTS